MHNVSLILCSTEKLGKYMNKDIELLLPESVSIKYIDWISVYCKQAATSFGHVTVPHDTIVPQYMSVSTRLHVTPQFHLICSHTFVTHSHHCARYIYVSK